jgi:UDP-N-acetylmuramoyl-tripeptide--D-alanyl-D-alanine ligase
MKLALARVVEFISAGGKDHGDAVVQGYSIDSRTVAAGELFFAVKGERLNGHDFVTAALERGAVAAVVLKDQRSRYPETTPLLAVDDTLIALQTLATAVRKVWGKPLPARRRPRKPLRTFSLRSFVCSSLRATSTITSACL